MRATSALPSMVAIALAMACTRPPHTDVPAAIPDRLVVLTFDDAVKSHYTTVAPLLARYVPADRRPAAAHAASR